MSTGPDSAPPSADPAESNADAVVDPAHPPLTWSDPSSWFAYTTTSTLVGAALGGLVAAPLVVGPVATLVASQIALARGDYATNNQMVLLTAPLALGVPVLTAVAVTVGAIVGAAVADGVWPALSAFLATLPAFVFGAVGTVTALAGGVVYVVWGLFPALDQGEPIDRGTLALGASIFFAGAAIMGLTPLACGAAATGAATLAGSDHASLLVEE